MYFKAVSLFLSRLFSAPHSEEKIKKKRVKASMETQKRTREIRWNHFITDTSAIYRTETEPTLPAFPLEAWLIDCRDSFGAWLVELTWVNTRTTPPPTPLIFSRGWSEVQIPREKFQKNFFFFFWRIYMSKFYVLLSFSVFVPFFWNPCKNEASHVMVVGVT